jgi:hypothetical protein
MGNIHPMLLPVLTSSIIILAAALALFCSLSVHIKDNILLCFFGIGLIRKSIPLSEIQQARTVQNPWYTGWGIRWMPGQYLLWNVSGYRAVELTLTNGNRFRIGTDEPETLLNAINALQQMRHPA